MRLTLLLILCIINIVITVPVGITLSSSKTMANIIKTAQESLPLIGNTSSGSYLKSRHAENIGDFASAASFTAQLLSTNPQIKGITRRGHILMISSGRINEAAKFAEIIVRKHDISVYY